MGFYRTSRSSEAMYIWIEQGALRQTIWSSPSASMHEKNLKPYDPSEATPEHLACSVQSCFVYGLCGTTSLCSALWWSDGYVYSLTFWMPFDSKRTMSVVNTDVLIGVATSGT